MSIERAGERRRVRRRGKYTHPAGLRGGASRFGLRRWPPRRAGDPPLGQGFRAKTRAGPEPGGDHSGYVEPEDQAPHHDREAILSAVMEEARLEAAGELPDCQGCRKPIRRTSSLYRCSECSLPFHLHCIRKHFAKHADPTPGSQVDDLDNRGV